MRKTLLVALPLLALIACSPASETDFESVFPPPAWWDRVEAPELETRSELLDYWRDRERSDEQLFKACYQAIANHIDEPAIAVPAVSFLQHGDPSWEHLLAAQEWALDRWWNWDRPLANYGGRSGDTIAGIARNVASVKARSGQAEEAARLVRRLLDERGHEINPQLLQLLAFEEARALVELGDRDGARRVLTWGLDQPGDWNEKLQKELDRLR